VSGFALALVVAAAFIHASWNYLLKRSGGGPGLIAATAVASLAIYAPVAAFVAWQSGWTPQPVHLAVTFLSGLVHTAYFLLLDRAYRGGGDLSIVYPLARATGPLLTVAFAIAVLGERPGPWALAGALLIGASALVLAGNPFSQARGHVREAVGFALLTGLMIAVYTVLDKRAVATFLIPPLAFDWMTNGFRCAVIVPWARHQAPGGMGTAWRERRRTVVAIAVLSPLSYIFVLTAMVFTPVSLVAPARELSILFAALMGAHFLREGNVARRLAAAAGMALGIAGLTMG
jgi:drug/metabolite transporter (DMT)-like permease